MINLFQFENYKQALNAAIAANGRKRGYKAWLADALGCQRSYLSQVLNADADLSPEHAINLASHWDLPASQAEYFLLLVQSARAGNSRLKSFYQAKAKVLREENENLAKRLQSPHLRGVEQQAEYYSAWYYAAIHIIVTIPEFQSVEAVASRLGLSRRKVAETLDALTEMGLVRRHGARFSATEKQIHLGKRSPLDSVNHAQWRAKAVEEARAHLGPGKESGIHYTCVHSLSRSDQEKLRQMMLDFIENTRAVALPSKEETLLVLTCDLFSP